jgi:hypothetical protein
MVGVLGFSNTNFFVESSRYYFLYELNYFGSKPKTLYIHLEYPKAFISRKNGINFY